MLFLQHVLPSLLAFVPASVMRRLAARYIAGETLEEALERLADLGRAGHPGILNLLGEHVQSPEEARTVADEYRRAASRISALGIDAYISVKPTQFGLCIDEELPRHLFEELCRHCAALGVLVRVEMEDHTTTDATIRLFESLRGEHRNLGLVLQARLLRTPADVEALGAGPLDVRIVKGIYLEPPEIAHTGPEPIREAFVECSRVLLRRGARIGFATHDEGLAERVAALVCEVGSDPAEHEFQVLMGVQERLWERWKLAGHRVRVYVPYGPEWRTYSLRRMRKNPEIVGHLARNFFRRA